jgi:aspartate/methionine/tyrosine aminotransferase
MSADLQMARGSADGETNLAIGEPYFLQEFFLRYLLVDQTPKALHYPSVGGEPELLEELKNFFPHHKYLVITNGAKQAIEAAFFAFKRLERKSVVFHQAPYWPSYPTLAKSQGLEYNVASPLAAQIFCVTAPNNPDGGQPQLFKRAPDLWDAAYAQPLYGFHGVPPPHRVAVFSAAKYLGLSGLRVGWLATNEKEIAEQAGYFVEITTSGVSIPSQMHLAGCLRSLRRSLNMAWYTERTFEARAALMANGHSFNEIIGDLVKDTQGVPVDGTGMFAWFRARRPESFARALRDAKVKLVSGDACGVHEPGWYRMSMGHLPEVTREALLRIKDQYLNSWVSK